MKREPWTFARAVLALFLGLAGLSMTASCGGGPNVASATGHYLYLASSNGIYGFSILSNNTLSPLSSSALATGSYTSLLVDKTPPGSTSSVLFATTASSSTLTSFTINSNGTLGTAVTFTPSSCLGTYSSLAVTPDGKYLFAVDTSTKTASNIAFLDLSTASPYTCTPDSYATAYPVSIALDCTTPGGSLCNFLVTTSSSATPISPTVPQIFLNWTTGSSTFPTPTSMSVTTFPEYAEFSLSTVYYYLTIPNSSVITSLNGSTAATATNYTASVSFNYPMSTPCTDILSNALYLPTTNGSVYQFSVDTSGNIQSPGQLWSLSSTPSIPTIYACAVLD